MSSTDVSVLEADLQRLISFNTVSHRPNSELAAWLARRCEDMGFEVERFEDAHDQGKCSLICRIGPRDQSDGLVLSGHMDVVPTEGQPWTSDPFRLTTKGDHWFGRGTADMKGFFAATLQALARIDRKSYRKPLVLIWTHDEEIGCLGSRALAQTLSQRDAPLPKAALIGEPTHFKMLRMHPGHVACELQFQGKAAHSSRPDLGINAIEAAAQAVGVIQELAHELEQEPADIPELSRPIVAVNTATISGGSAINIVPDACTLRLGYRPLPGMRAEDVFERLQAKLQHAGVMTEAKLLRITPAMLTPNHTTLQHHLTAHASEPTCGAASFATDGGNLATLGIESIIFGPGAIEVAHQADEFVPIAEVVRCVDIVEELVRAMCC